MGVYAAAAEQNDAQLYAAINAVQGCAWKQAEIRLYGDDVATCMNIARSAGAIAAGMSSLGPMVYFFSESFDETCSLLQQRLPMWRLIKTSPRNMGREVLDA
jgi:predicted sugar kinase